VFVNIKLKEGFNSPKKTCVRPWLRQTVDRPKLEHSYLEQLSPRDQLDCIFT